MKSVQSLRLGTMTLLVIALSCDAWAYLSQGGPSLLRYVESRFGSHGRAYLEHWQRDETRVLAANKEHHALLAAVNALANQVPAVSDFEHWGQPEYWATPAEFVASHGGDCEDFAIAKYFSLRAAGIPAEQLRFVYVKALTAQRIENHMVLAWYPTPTADPLILDNLDPRLRPAAERSDLLPVFSFNDEAVSAINPMVRRWRELLQKIQGERQLSCAATSCR